jgi:hypothetical protein
VYIACSNCGRENIFDQPYPYHAGFSNVGFLYNDNGNRTLIWSSYDAAYEEIVGKVHPWMLSEQQRGTIEAALPPALDGGRWRFANPPRCVNCRFPIGRPISDDISYLVYPGSVDLSDLSDAEGLRALLARDAV